MSAGLDAVDEGIFPPAGAGSIDPLALGLLLSEARELVQPKVIRVPTPAVATDWTTTVPAGTVWLLLSLAFTLTTDANAANRAVAINATDGTDTVMRAPPSLTQPASQIYNYGFARHYPATLSGDRTAGVTAPLPAIPYVGGLRIASATSSLQAGDAFTLIRLYVLEIRQRTRNELLQLAAALSDGSYDTTYPGLRLGL